MWWLHEYHYQMTATVMEEPQTREDSMFVTQSKCEQAVVMRQTSSSHAHL